MASDAVTEAAWAAVEAADAMTAAAVEGHGVRVLTIRAAAMLEATARLRRELERDREARDLARLKTGWTDL